MWTLSQAVSVNWSIPCLSRMNILQAEDAVLAVGPLVANHFGARFALLAWSGAGILKRGTPLCTIVYHTLQPHSLLTFNHHRRCQQESASACALLTLLVRKCQGYHGKLSCVPVTRNHVCLSTCCAHTWHGSPSAQEQHASCAGMIVRPGNGAEQTLVREAPTIPELYSRTVASDPGSTYDQSSFVPQVSQTLS